MNTSTDNKPDMVNSPPHYQRGGMECIQAIKAMLSNEEYKGYLKGTILKYLWRGPDKGNEEQDYQKAMWYLKQLNEVMSNG